jgi:hypothetical protein
MSMTESKRMETVERIWDTGLTTPYDLDGDGTVAFKSTSGSVRVKGICWNFRGSSHAVDSYADVLPDMTGVAVPSPRRAKGGNWMDVINADGSLRFRLHPPPLDARFDHTQSLVESVSQGWPASGIALGVRAAYIVKAGSLGSIGILLDIDWTSGELKAWHCIPPWV